MHAGAFFFCCGATQEREEFTNYLPIIRQAGIDFHGPAIYNKCPASRTEPLYV